jgi:hypothetical protein
MPRAASTHPLEHQESPKYVGAEAKAPLKSIYDDMVAAYTHRSNSWIRLTTGEIIVIDYNGGMISQIRPPLNGLPAAFPQPVPVPLDIQRFTPAVRAPRFPL